MGCHRLPKPPKTTSSVSRASLTGRHIHTGDYILRNGGFYTQLETENQHDTSIHNNFDPNHAAVRVWPLPYLEIDGLNYKATLVSFYPMIFKGDKLPTGGNFSNGMFIEVLR